MWHPIVPLLLSPVDLSCRTSARSSRLAVVPLALVVLKQGMGALSCSDHSPFSDPLLLGGASHEEEEQYPPRKLKIGVPAT
ncbi:hypothetical protein I79_021553 [Cricetulus griseus]|uniref:Uncharacterized protein n=1 Tax=Cricetulus griseus TaxID=10029 RepID=G3ICZ2_CRIGR|nr:hypothetical protein I79_021553 [Cricetulus griseus]